MNNMLVAAAGITLLSLSACSATLSSNVPFQYTPSLVASESGICRLGVDKLTDHRPPEDRETTEEIADVDEKITAKLIEDLKSSNLFSGVHYSSDKTRDDFVLQGEIRRFSWKASTNPVVWIPLVNLSIYFGAPIVNVESAVQLTVRLLDARTGQVAGEYKKLAEREKSYSLYDNLKAGEAGAELADSLRTVVKQTKEAIAVDIRKPRGTP